MRAGDTAVFIQVHGVHAGEIYLAGLIPVSYTHLDVYKRQDYNCIYMIANRHAITVRQTPADLRRQTREAAALLLACGIDPDRSCLLYTSVSAVYLLLSAAGGRAH